MKDEIKIKRMEKLRSDVLDLNKYPEILGEFSGQETYPDSKIETAYCTLLWEIDEEIRRLVKK